MRLEAQKAVIAGSVELLENFRQMSVACACRNDFAGSKERVLDVDEVAGSSPAGRTFKEPPVDSRKP